MSVVAVKVTGVTCGNRWDGVRSGSKVRVSIVAIEVTDVSSGSRGEGCP